MERSTRVYLFGDQTNSFDAGLRRLLQIKDNGSLTSFLERTRYALQLEIGHLPVFERQLFPRFTSVLDLLARYRESGNHPALESTFTCIHQLAAFISHYGAGVQTYPLPSETYLVGLCTGSLAAAAISCSRNIAELLPAAVEAVLVAFRTGLRATEVRDRLELSDGTSACWSIVVPGIQQGTASTVLKDFCRARTIPLSSQPYISSVNSRSLTISGPPKVLEQLLQCPAIKESKPIQVSVHAPYHAAHLYGESDLDVILGSSSQAILNSYVPKFPIISSASGKLINAPDYNSLLRVVLADILQEPLCWDKTIEGCTSAIRSSNSPHCKIIPVACSASQGLISTIRQNGNVQVELDDAITNAGTNIKSQPPTGRPEQSKIAIVGLSGRFPDADSTELFWDLLYKGLDVHREIPKDRFDVKTHVDPTGKNRNTSSTPYGCFIENPGLFDARFFNMSPREASQADPAQRLAILTAYEALEMSGFVPNRTPSTQRDRVGIFYGMTSDDWREVNSGQNIDTYFIPGGNRAFTPGRINYHFKFSGPSYSVDTACSSSLAAIHLACNSLWKGDCDTALAGGTNVLTNPDNFAGLDRGHFLSKTGNCKTFDDGADGYCRADGVGTVILKRLEDAEADNDPIQGVILGAYTNHSAEAVSMTRPHVGAQSFIFDKMINAANLDPLDISYIEMHGTGTQAGDAVEMSSVLDVFAPKRRNRGPQQSLYLGSAKSNIGHGESASGVTSLIKVLKMMEKSIIPPHCGIKTKINHNFPTDLTQRNVHIAMKPTPWTRPEGEKRKVFLNNFSAAGGNTALLMEDAPAHVARPDRDPRSMHLVAISAKSIPSLKNNVKALSDFIEKNPDTPLSSLSYTTTARRMHHNHRVIVNGSNLKTIKERLEAPGLCDGITVAPPAGPSVAFAFTGQGSQYIAMGKQLFENFSQFTSDIRRFDSIGQSQGFPSIQPLIDGSVPDIKELSPLVVQLGTTCLQMALARLWISWGVQPTVVIGHSLGEYAALNVAGVLSASDTIYLTGKRAQLLQEQCTTGTHTMLAVKASHSTMTAYVDGRSSEIACINAPEDTVISGENLQIDMLSDNLTAHSVKSIKLKVPFAFHSAQVQPILENFEASAKGITFGKPSIPIISPLLAKVITEAGTVGPAYLGRHCREAVDFLGGIKAAKNMKVITDTTMWVEIGSHPVCSGMIKATIGPKVVTLPSLKRDEDTWKILTGSLASLHAAGAEIQWSEYHRDFSASHDVLQLPAYCWDYKNHWIQYVHDWCLTKGMPPALTLPEVVTSRLSTSSVQRVIEEHVEKNKATIVVESDLSVPHLNATLQGHKVNGIALCSSSVYADIALTIGDYMLTQFKPAMKHTSMDVSSMSVGKALIAKNQGTQLLRVSATADWASASVALQFYSVTAQGQKIVDHANCILKYADGGAWAEEWKRSAYLIKGRINSLQEGVDGGKTHKIKRGMAYKLFGALVEYDQKFKGLEEVVLDSTALEATARVVLQATEKDGDFYQNPYWIDSLGQISGFTMNANDAVDSKSQVFINHGWESMRCSKKFSFDKSYRTYVKMQKSTETMFVGDVYIFEEDVIVAVYGGIKFQGVPRQVLNSVLPPVTASKSSPSPVAKPIPSHSASAPALRQKLAKPAAVQVSRSPVPISAPKKSNESAVMGRALAMVAEEIGVATSDLSDDSAWADFGVDSLLSLTISGKLREEFDMDVESSLFSECPTVKDLKLFFSRQSADEDDSSESAEASSLESSDAEGTPETGSEFADDESATSIEDDETDTIAAIRLTLAEEIGVAVEELTGTSDLGSLGMDSLLSLTVLGKLRETLDIDLPSDFFAEHTTMNAIEATLGGKPKAAAVPSRPERISPPVPKKTTSKELPSASSILLQGNPKTARKKLFLFPDGSGSATSYATLPKVDPDVVVYGLNCPYMKKPQDLKCGLGELTVPYLAEIRRRQPHGPYSLGGWSAGGICAYDAAQEFLRHGEQVDRLILLDSPFPIGLSKLPPRLYRFFESIGLFGTGKEAPPEWLLPHFLAFVDVLDAYDAVPFAPGTAPKTHLIWAHDGVCNKPDDPRPARQNDDPKEMWWLIENRKDMGPNGWDSLVGGENLNIESMQEANHFTMMQGKNGQILANFIARSMA